jgi:PTH1 family peptidyl-tRNA hydrolase
MKLIVGLGNPGTKYQNNRHNVGFMFVDYLVSELTSWRVNEFGLNKKLSKLVIDKKKHNASCFMFHDLTLLKPQTFMNRSGEEVKKIIRNSKFVIGDLIVVHDDLDIPLGKFKIQLGTGPQLHNGIISIEQHLGPKDFWRIRIGVDNRLAHHSPGDGGKAENWIDGETRYRMVPGETYVLKNFLSDEKEAVNKVFPMIFQRLKDMKMI